VCTCEHNKYITKGFFQPWHIAAKHNWPEMWIIEWHLAARTKNSIAARKKQCKLLFALMVSVICQIPNLQCLWALWSEQPSKLMGSYKSIQH
jgi:hypothetical protein